MSIDEMCVRYDIIFRCELCNNLPHYLHFPAHSFEELATRVGNNNRQSIIGGSVEPGMYPAFWKQELHLFE